MIRLFGFMATMVFVILSYSFSTPQEYKAEIPRIVEKNQKDVKACLAAVKDKPSSAEKEMGKKQAEIKGELILTWEIDEKGKPRNFSRDGGTFDNQDFFHCLQKKISKWKFPKPPMDRAIDIRHEFLL